MRAQSAILLDYVLSVKSGYGHRAFYKKLVLTLLGGVYVPFVTRVMRGGTHQNVAVSGRSNQNPLAHVRRQLKQRGVGKRAALLVKQGILAAAGDYSKLFPANHIVDFVGEHARAVYDRPPDKASSVVG